eukprot:TRINITY_DN18221_c0_g1_i1.p1 TRINITY_DN18221_c0_g1~~TRINITY_DN18221_c0_g1_i1.p1  ORF type:complete len:359 (+),score=65.13 TRINITY_DN18221_c0_g1_i1:43-1077(+)
MLLRNPMRIPLLVSARWRRGRDEDDMEIPFASINKFDWGGSSNTEANVQVHGVDLGGLNEDEFRQVVEKVVPDSNGLSKLSENQAEKQSPSEEVIFPTEDALQRLADLTSDKLAEANTHQNLLSDYPELKTLPGMSQVLGRYREKTETEQRVMEGIVSDSLVESPQGEIFEKSKGEQDMWADNAHFSPEVRKLQIQRLTTQLTNSNLHALPKELEAVQASNLHLLTPWEHEVEEPPLPDEYWEMSSAERRFLGLPYRDEATGLWSPPQATFTSRAAEDINLKAFRGIMDKVRTHGGSKEALVREEVTMLREAEEKIFDHLRAKLEDMAPFLDERSKVWRRRREG